MHDHPGSVSLHHVVDPCGRPTATAAGRGLIENDREFLARCSLLRALPANERSTLIAHARIRTYAAGETVFLMGSAGDSMMVVLSGHVRISVGSPDGKEAMIAVLVPGDSFGEIALLDGKERSSEARAAGECRLAILNRRDVLAFFEQHPNAWPGLVLALCERLRTVDEQMAEMALMAVPVRLAKALLRLAAIAPQTGKHRCEVRLSQREIGSLIGATRESVNKWLRHWQRMGILRTAEGLIAIADRRALEELAQPGSNGEVRRDLLRQPGRAGSADPSSTAARLGWTENGSLERRARSSSAVM